ncbi:MAG: CRISPR-associated helicase Cas3', partial [Phototrophicales bacterium]
GLAQRLDAVVVGNTAQEREQFQQLPSQNKERYYHARDEPLCADVVLERHSELPGHQKRSLVICNTVDRARELFSAIRERSDAEVLLLHSRLLPEDRNQTEDKIREVFGKEHSGGDYIVVSTQAIEVGVDMSSAALHTELAPANTIIQRAGRCARYENEVGHVFIYRHAFKNDEQIDLLAEVNPYRGQEDEFHRAWQKFTEYNGRRLTFDDEQDILTFVHGDRDKHILQSLDEKNHQYRQNMYAVMRGDEGTDARHLVREIIQQQVTIHDNPKELLDDPFAYPSFGLHPGTLQGYIKEWLNSDNYHYEGDIVAIRENKDRDRFEDDAQANDERFYTYPVNDPKSGWMAPLLVVHPRLATYDPVLGFVANAGGDWVARKPESEKRETSTRPQYCYRKETYEKHIELVYRAFEEFWPEALWAAQQLERRFGWPQGSVTKAAQLAV